ncbi:hypothetical protein CkaCkLH20_02850 [Colletotrichum karsti]|uniref:Uncharacterized protein n=1 Tax=Colletotrichum karsti TaxID=1095194 RepID=A0A9P6IC01_9PEZI|nr:uncharacterized protein CkaCkLH20_02850 [Colletotrichum karsti]KAF9880039.1 hypothetical protein CkaCkLH20_02850 [Colletotrichum karsti]
MSATTPHIIKDDKSLDGATLCGRDEQNKRSAQPRSSGQRFNVNDMADIRRGAIDEDEERRRRRRKRFTTDENGEKSKSLAFRLLDFDAFHLFTDE